MHRFNATDINNIHINSEGNNIVVAQSEWKMIEKTFRYFKLVVLFSILLHVYLYKFHMFSHVSQSVFCFNSRLWRVCKLSMCTRYLHRSATLLHMSLSARVYRNKLWNRCIGSFIILYNIWLVLHNIIQYWLESSHLCFNNWYFIFKLV